MGNLANYVGIFLFLFGLTFGLVGFISKRRAAASQNWPTTTGQIVSSFIHTSTSTDGDGSVSTSYEPKVEYSYNVMGSPMTGHRIAFGAMGSDYASAQKVLTSYPMGTAVSVHYNPEKPADSVLESKARGGNVFLIIGIICMAAGIVLPFFM